MMFFKALKCEWLQWRSVVNKVHVKKTNKQANKRKHEHWLKQALQAEVTLCHGISQLVSNTGLCVVHSHLNVSVSFTNEKPMQYKNTNVVYSNTWCQSKLHQTSVTYHVAKLLHNKRHLGAGRRVWAPEVLLSLWRKWAWWLPSSQH